MDLKSKSKANDIFNLHNILMRSSSLFMEEGTKAQSLSEGPTSNTCLTSVMMFLWPIWCLGQGMLYNAMYLKCDRIFRHPSSCQFLTKRDFTCTHSYSEIINSEITKMVFNKYGVQVDRGGTLGVSQSVQRRLHSEDGVWTKLWETDSIWIGRERKWV